MKSIVFLILLLLAVSLSLFFFLKDNEETKDKVNSATSTTLSTPTASTPTVTTPKTTTPKGTQSIVKYFDIRYYFNNGASGTPRATTRSATTPAGTPRATRSATTPVGTQVTTPAGTTSAATHAATYPSGTQVTTPAGTTSAATHAATYPSVYTTSPNKNTTTTSKSNTETFIESFVVKDPSDNTYDVADGSEIYNTEGLLYIGKHDPTNYGELLSDLEDKYQELKDRVTPECDTSIKCIADFGTNIGEDLCCGQTGVLQDTKYVCPSNKPTCGNFKCGSQFGQCS